MLGRYDVVVIGGGTGGAPAGIAAARQGAKTLVVEQLTGLGGVGTMGAISTYCSGNRVGFTARWPAGNSWVIEQKMEWWRASSSRPAADIWFGAIGCGASSTRAASAAWWSSPRGRGVVLAKAVIDATGNADVAAAAGAAVHLHRRERVRHAGHRPAAARSGDPERRKRFIQEARTASSLSHPNIITIHDIFQEGDTHFIVMEYVAGQTLLDLIPPTGMPAGQMLLFAAQMAAALSAAHQAGIIHRDFKPANVMVTASGLVKVLDFGLAKLMQPQTAWMTSPLPGSGDSETVLISDQLSHSTGPQTAEGSILGTVNYMSPEQAEGKRVDGRSDIFSLGAVLYEMVTGRRAFQGESDISTLSAVLRDEVRPISALSPAVPRELEDFINACLRKDPNARWQTMTEVEMVLAGLKRRWDAGALPERATVSAAVAEAPKSAPRVAASEVSAASSISLKKVLFLGATCLVLLLAAGALWWLRTRPHAATQVVQQPATASQTPASAAVPAPDQPVSPAASAPASALPRRDSGSIGSGAAGCTPEECFWAAASSTGGCPCGQRRETSCAGNCCAAQTGQDRYSANVRATGHGESRRRRAFPDRAGPRRYGSGAGT